jgi:hypothetical protein
MWDHREDLISRVDHVLTQLNQGLLGSPDQEKSVVDGGAVGQAKEGYTKLRGWAEEVGRGSNGKTDSYTSKVPNGRF